MPKGTLRRVAGSIASTPSRALGWAVDHPDQCTLWAFIIGFVLCILAIMLGVHSVSFRGVLEGGVPVAGVPVLVGGEAWSKEVGYLPALNWSLFSVVVVPVLIWFGLNVLAAMETLPQAMADRGMLRDASFARVAAEDVASAWDKNRREHRILFTVIFGLVLLYMLYDWWTVVAHPLLNPASIHASFSDPLMEFDWSVASAFEDSNVGRIGLLCFTFVAYLAVAGFPPAFSFGVVISAVHFVNFVMATPSPARPWRLAAIPSSTAGDKHHGFECFGSYFNALVLTSLCVLFSLQFMVIQNAYLRDPSSNLMDFIIRDITNVTGGQLLQLPEWLFEPMNTTLSNPQTAFSYMLYPFVCVLAVGSAWLLLRTGAVRARDFTKAKIDALAAESGRTPADLKMALAQMDVWPVGWLRLNQLFLLMAILFMGLLSYRLIFVPIAFFAWVILQKTPDLFKSRRSST